MEKPIPKWLDSEFLAQCLKTEMNNENVVIASFSISRAAPPGDNYISCPFRIKIMYKHHIKDKDFYFKSLIIKSEATDCQMKDVAESLDFSEPLFYNKFLPEVIKLVETSIVPKSLPSPLFSIVVLEDLRDLGFKMASKSKKLDFDHSVLYIKAAANLHAASVVIHKDDPSLVETIGKEKMFANDLEIATLLKSLIRNGCKCLIDCVGEMEQFRKYRKLLKDTSAILWDLLVEAVKTQKLLNTINQGDPWLTNMMFKYDEKEKVKEIRLLDFQLLRYGSPANDLVWFIWSSVSHDVRRNRLEDLYQIYVETFNCKLREFRCEDVTLDYSHFKEEIDKLSTLALYIVAAFPIFNSEKAVVDLSPFFLKENEDEEALKIYKSYYNEDYCNNEVPRFLEEMEMAGVFSHLQRCHTNIS
ncbi:LOW QUALITY PROTEIN: uncharacterized protein LOC124369670 [Homalodisca vitripennis]|uniref:LOW QUALITY PROTEIN: uncharacterized protein LOC124369670 n=1 Tax=Homalodisca vitripennis TaxID=197043 RepID=UPI001EEA1EDF|nr:LOW QUALITY PROTEIN: uncharacterized protein LOC124369670 [Homalodisca vitripennis]